MPTLLSRTGAFSDTARMIPSPGLVPYDLVVSFWSDGAAKRRYIAIPRGRIKFDAKEPWAFPAGTVFVKTFELAVDAAHPEQKRRLETRLLVRDAGGGVYGVVYKWRPDNSDADLLGAGEREPVSIKDEAGSTRTQTWYYPSRTDCLQCHNARAGGVLGANARQLNRDYAYPDGSTENELRHWDRLGVLGPVPRDSEFADIPTLAAMDDPRRNLEDRARSYLDANCSQCHRPGGTVAYFDARFSTPLAQQQIIDGAVLIDQGIDRPRVISPHDIWRSIAYMRIDTNDDIRMPPIARMTVDQHGVQLLADWIHSLPGRDVLDPPTIAPAGGTFDNPLDVTLDDNDPAADIRYTLDGSVPGAADAHYDGPIHLTAPAVVRARAFRPGYTRSITVQQAFAVGSQ